MKDTLQEVHKGTKNLQSTMRESLQVNRLLTIAVVLLAVSSVFSTTVNSSRLLDLKTVIDQQNIVQEAPIMTDLPYRKLGNFELTWYCPCEKCVGKKKVVKTATGTKPTANRTIAVDPHKIPLGSIVYIDGYGYFIAEDTGSAIKSNRIDIFVDSHQEALQLGKRHANVYLLK